MYVLNVPHVRMSYRHVHAPHMFQEQFARSYIYRYELNWLSQQFIRESYSDRLLQKSP